jgi:hypothetical protein
MRKPDAASPSPLSRPVLVFLLAAMIVVFVLKLQRWHEGRSAQADCPPTART